MITVLLIVSSVLWAACTAMLMWAFFNECKYKRVMNANLLKIKDSLMALNDSLSKLGRYNVSLGDGISQLMNSVKIQHEAISALINEVQKIEDANKKMLD